MERLNTEILSKLVGYYGADEVLEMFIEKMKTSDANQILYELENDYNQDMDELNQEIENDNRLSAMRE